MFKVVYQLNKIPGFNQLINKEESSSVQTNSLNLNTVYYTTKNNLVYKIIRYDKNYLSSDLIRTAGLLRSLVLNNKNHAVSFAPPKSIPYDVFSTIYPIKNNDMMRPEDDGVGVGICRNILIAEEFVEGTMINVFWNPTSSLCGSWEFSTRNTIGGEISFYKTGSSFTPGSNNISKTFHEMFLEAVNYNNVDLNILNPRFCYSFVLQHHDIRVVIPFKNPQLYLVDVYEIVNTENGTINIFPSDLNQVKHDGNWYNTTIKFPTIYDDWNSYDDLITTYASMNTSYDVVGVVIRNKMTHERTKLRNPVYENIRHMQGNNLKLQYQYLCLRQQGKVGDFLNVYPEHKSEFSKIRDNLHKFTATLFQNYISCFIRKELLLDYYSAQFRTHMCNIHKIYTTILKLNKDYVSKQIVVDYVNKLSPQLQMHILNYSMRKRRVDFLKADHII